MSLSVIAALSLGGAATPDTLDVPPEHEEVLEELIDAEADAADLQERLHELASRKVDVNRADEDELHELPGLSPVDAARIIRLRKHLGRIRTLSELRTAGIDSAAVERIRPYVRLRKRQNVSLRTEVVQRWSRRLEPAQGYAADSNLTGYAGSPTASLTRLRIDVGDRARLGATLEKDAGESFRLDHRRPDLGFDFAAGYAVVRNVGPIGHILIGDFSANAGEGLALGHAGSRRSSGPPARPGELLRPHSSSREYAFFRGIGIHTRAWRGLSVAMLASRRRIDASSDTMDGSWSFATAGLHRTPSEIARRKRGRESTLGASLRYRRGAIVIGLLAAQTTTSASSYPIRRQVDASTTVTVTNRTISVSVEGAKRDTAPAFSGSLIYQPADVVRFWMTGLSTLPGASAPHSAVGATARGQSRRETSWRGGIRLRASASTTVDLTSLHRSAPQHLVESGTRRTAGSFSYSPRKWISVRLRAVDERAARRSTCKYDMRTVRCAEEQHRQAVRLQADYVHSASFRNRIRLETARARFGTDPIRHGMLLFEDIRWKPYGWLRLDVRLLFFDIDDYAARLYAYENDVTYAFSTPVFSGRGRRLYVLLDLRLHRTISLQAKAARTTYEDVRSVGSGLEQTSGRRRTDVRLQLRWSFD